LNTESRELYHSNFGKTADGLIKPEIIAPAMFVAAPILPETKDYEIAETLSILASAPDYSFQNLLQEFWQQAGFSADILSLEKKRSTKIYRNQASSTKNRCHALSTR